MQNRIVLNIALVTDTNCIYVAARSDVRPDAGAFANHHVSNHLRALIDVSGSGDPGFDAAIGTNHDCGVSLNRSTRFPNRTETSTRSQRSQIRGSKREETTFLFHSALPSARIGMNLFGNFSIGDS